MKKITLPLLLIAVLFAQVGLAADEPEAISKEWLYKLTEKARSIGYSGLEFKTVIKGEHSYLKVANVAADSPAAQAGLWPGDLLVAINGVEINRDADRWAAMKEAGVGHQPGAAHTYLIKRKEGGEWVKKSVRVELTEPTIEAMAQMVGKAVLKKMSQESRQASN